LSNLLDSYWEFDAPQNGGENPADSAHGMRYHRDVLSAKVDSAEILGPIHPHPGMPSGYQRPKEPVKDLKKVRDRPKFAAVPIIAAKKQPEESMILCRHCRTPYRMSRHLRHLKNCPILVAELNAARAGVRPDKREGAVRSPPAFTEHGALDLPFDGIEIEEHSAQLLTKGSWDVDRVIAHYEQVVNDPQSRLYRHQLDTSYLRRLATLKPIVYHWCEGDFDGYIALEFPNSKRVVFECPMTDNATYILGGDWESALGHTKLYLRTRCPAFRSACYHTENWLERIKAALF
jgi:hypothetical protein